MNTFHRVGLAVLALLAVADVVTPLVSDGEHPPMTVALVACTLGLMSLVCLPGAWRGRRPLLIALVTTRLLSALLALPAFFVDDVPTAAVAASGAVAALTVVGVVLVGSRRAVPA
ncbi:MAG: hypothetical protein ACRDO7_10565 [Nocardioidaceae bacterium]